jgi:RNA polymerase sigma factor (sigma-70 family)
MGEYARARWIAAHILPYEHELRLWLKHHLNILNATDVDDLVQEVFARIWAADCSSIRNGRAYLYATVRHLLTEQARHNRVVAIQLLGELEALNLISEEPGPDRQVAAWQELAQVQAVIARLPKQCRRVFELRKLRGLSHDEIAEQMGISKKTVLNHLTRALARLTDALASQNGLQQPVHEHVPAQRSKAERGDD